MLLRNVFLMALAILTTSQAIAEEKTPGEEMIDRLAVNMAGAFVKSMFPEMDRKQTEASTPDPVAPSSEIRRAPINPLMSSMQGYSPQFAASEYNAMPQMSQASETPRNPFAYQGNQPSVYSVMPEASNSKISQSSAAGMDALGALAFSGMNNMKNPDISGMLSGGEGTPEAINAVRNQAYLAELSKHQAELNAYSAKQMEYLDNQRRYQQAMIDHQAGAALLMQKQQQEIISKQMQNMKQSFGLNDGAPSESKDLEDNNNIGGNYLTARARGVKTMKAPTNRKLEDDDVIANDEYLKEYFKQKYNIDIPDDVSQLTADEKATLRALKRELSRQRDKVKEKGVFKTMDSLKGKMTKERASPSKSSSLSEACDQCIPMNAKMIRGAWTQIYGNPKVVNKVFGTIMSLENLKSSSESIKMSSKKTSCVGMEIGAASSRRKSPKINLFFRDSDEGNELHEMRGTVTVKDNIMNIETNLYRTHMCLVKAGPSESDRFEYVILAETTGKYACKSYHVFVRNTDEFNRRHFDDVSDFMKSQADAMPLGALPKSSLCELDSP